MEGVKHFSDFFKNNGKKELPKFDKDEILNDFFINESDEDSARKTAISNFPHIAKEESEKRDRRIEKSYEEDPDGMYPRDSERYDEPEYSGGWQDGMGEPPSNESDESYSKDEVDLMIQKEIERIKKETIAEFKANESKEIELPIEEYQEEEISESKDEYYKVWADKAETFSCDIELEGANLKDTEVRLVLESDNWNLMFQGEITKNGKVTIPIRKLNILEEGTRGTIKMEVIAEGTVFTPWEDQFEVKLSKKVMVKFNESKVQPKKPILNKPQVKVNFKNK
jgi:hypothetical protein